METNDERRRTEPPLPPTPEFAEARRSAPEDMRVGYPPWCTPTDEGTEKTVEFMNAMTPEVAQKYMGQWIAVANGEIVAHGENPEQVCEEGSRAGKGIILVEYIYAKPEEVPWFYVPKQ